jgi:hypothetical protein
MSVVDQFAPVKYRSETYCWTQKLNRKDYDPPTVDKYWVFCFFSRLRFEISRLRLQFLSRLIFAYENNPV